MTSESGHSMVSRRTVLRTAAWSAPAIAVAVALPAAAASGNARSCIVYNGPGGLVVNDLTSELVLDSDVFAALTTWLATNNLPWPSVASPLTRTFAVDCAGELDGQVYSFTAQGSASASTLVDPNGTLQGSAAVRQNAILASQQDFAAKSATFPQGVSFAPTGPFVETAVLQFAYSDDCTLTLTHTSPTTPGE